jgi:hypothetical protein
VVIPLSGRVSGRASQLSRSHVDDIGGLQYDFWKIDRVLRILSSRRIYRRKDSVRRWTRGPHQSPVRPGGGPRHGGGRPLAPLRLCFGLRLVSGKIGTSAFVSSNSENISSVTKCNKTQSKWFINKHGTSKIIDMFETYQSSA